MQLPYFCTSENLMKDKLETEPREKISTNPTFELLARQPAIQNCSNALHGLRGDNTAEVETDQLLCYINEVFSVFLLLFLDFFQPFY